MYGAQTVIQIELFQLEFENDVEMYGAQTASGLISVGVRFENDVEMYGAQTCLFGWFFQY